MSDPVTYTAVQADLGYEGEADALIVPVKKVDARPLSDDQRRRNALHSTTRALRRVGLCHWRIGKITAAALVLLRHMHRRTT